LNEIIADVAAEISQLKLFEDVFENWIFTNRKLGDAEKNSYRAFS
jgi:hypothetical protein